MNQMVTILENEQDKEELTTEIEKAIKDVCVAVMEEKNEKHKDNIGTERY